MPSLIDKLVDFAVPFFKNRIPHPAMTTSNGTTTDLVTETLFSSKENQIDFERVLQVFHIIRNFSFTDINIRPLAHHQKLRELLMAGLTLAPDSQYAELSRQCLDIMESISPQVVLVGANDPYLVIMGTLMFTNDRALILGALRSLTRVAVSEVNEKVLAIGNQDLIRRVSQLLLVDDEELVAATLEYLYQYTSLRGNFSRELVEHHPGNLVGLLTGYLSYKSALAPRSVPLNGTIHAIPATQLAPQKNTPQAPPTIPDLTDYLNLDEPYRCLGWLKETLLNGVLEDQLPFKELFGKYNSLFGTQKPLAVKEFYTVLKIAFPQPAAVEEAVKTNSTSMDDLILGNVKYAPLKSSNCKYKHHVLRRQRMVGVK
ncbi:hypothetical protein BX666DRAFT_146916 [Dichotomocladium elegans]|nr:hypothetical protein BX666DRAFT_146916 [Dichotomocladium elegans]